MAVSMTNIKIEKSFSGFQKCSKRLAILILIRQSNLVLTAEKQQLATISIVRMIGNRK